MAQLSELLPTPQSVIIVPSRLNPLGEFSDRIQVNKCPVVVRNFPLTGVSGIVHDVDLSTGGNWAVTLEEEDHSEQLWIKACQGSLI